MAGRPPKPKAILHLSNPDKARSRPEIGKKMTHLPPVPPHLSQVAGEIFLTTCEHLHEMGVLAKSDVEVVARYAICLDMLHRASTALKDVVEPVVAVLDPKTNEMRFTRNCPELDLFLQMSEQQKKLESDLGLSPVDRAKLGISRKDDDRQPGDNFNDLLDNAG